jgi:carboxyl-terminal processing protease
MRLRGSGDRIAASGHVAAGTVKSGLTRRRAAAVCGLIAAGSLGACVAAQNSGTDAFSAERADQVFAAGYESISTRYVKDIAIGPVALEGMDGISEIDSAIHVDRSGGEVEVKRNGSTVAQFPAPGNDDPDAWAQITAKVLGASRAASPGVMSASSEQMYQVVFDRVLSRLDEFSRYAGRDLANSHRALRDGFGGIGFEFSLSPDQTLRVSSIVPDTPAERNGLRTGDIITEIDGKPVAGLDREEISHRLRGPVNSSVALSVHRAGTDGEVKLTFERALIVPPTVTAALDDGIAYFSISSFNQRTAETLGAAYGQLKEQGTIKGVILDLRNNPGGLLDQAIAVADLFLDGGEIVATHGRHPDSNQRFEASGNDVAKGLPIAVLINGDSASAAEIVAAALQDQKRAVLVGSNSFGKGTVQNVIHLPNDGELTLTWSRIEAPSGYAFHKLGIMPTLCTAKSPADVHEIVADLRGGRIASGPVLAAWRGEHDGDKSADELRASCPPRHDLSAADIEVAKDVLEDSDLYARALDLDGAPAVAAASSPPATDSVATR